MASFKLGTLHCFVFNSKSNGVLAWFELKTFKLVWCRVVARLYQRVRKKGLSLYVKSHG